MTARHGSPRPGCRSGPAGGATLIELLCAIGILATLTGVSIPAVTAGRDSFRAAGAARHLAATVHEARSRAVQAGAHVALRFRPRDGAITCVEYLDGNHNGVRTGDITAGIDRAISPERSLSRDFAGVEFGVWPGTPDIETGAPLPDNGLRIGSAGLLSFGPDGSSTSGTLYLKGRGNLQYAVRVLGATGRVRVLRFDAATRTWVVP